MAEARKGNMDLLKKTCREKTSQFRGRISEPYKWFIRYMPAVCVFVCAIVIGRLWWYNIAFPTRCIEIDDLCREGIETSLLTNIVLTLGVIYASITLLFNVSLRPKWWHLPIYIIAGTYIYFIPQWSAIQTVIPNLSYTVLLTDILSIITCGELGLLIMEKHTKETLNEIPSGEYGFVVRTDKNDMIVTGWDKYIETIFELVGKHQLEKESFAIGIAGSWGSGKTTFYEAIKRKINEDKKFLLCEFKPWQILESERITPEFFAEFAKVLSEGSESQDTLLRDNIMKYAQLLTAVSEVSGVVSAVTSIFGTDEEKSIQSLRNKIDEQLQNSKTNVVVLIDDLDRLNKEELLEIMRLVRASANFKHVLFILTYDRKYFADILENEQGIEYLKKIVNVEVNLPTFELYKYGQLLLQSVGTLFNENITDDPDTKKEIREVISLLDNIIYNENSQAEQSLLYEYLHNFRDIKRFANQLGLILRHLANLNALNDYNFSDLFWLEILHYTQEDMYNDLQFNYTKHLTIKNGNNRQDTLIPLNKESHPLLNKLFQENNVRPTINSIVRTNHYYSYFAHRQLDNYVSSVEFKLLMNSQDKEKVLADVNKWWSNDLTRDSLVQLLWAFPHYLKFETKNEADNYTYVLLDLLLKGAYSPRVNYKKCLPALLFKEKYHQAYFDRLNKYSPYVIINDQIMARPDIRLNSVLTAMCLTFDEELKNEEFDSPILTELYYVLPKNELSTIAELNYTLFFNGHDLPIADLFKKGSDYMNFILSLSYVEHTTGYKETIEYYNNLIGDYLTKRFDETAKEKFGDDEFKVIYANLLDMSHINENMDEEQVNNEVIDTICKVLGSTKNFEHLLNEHFTLSNENIKICKNLSLKINHKLSKPTQNWNGMSGGVY